MDKPNYTPLHPTKQALSGNGNGNGHHAQTFDPAAVPQWIETLPDDLREPMGNAIETLFRARVQGDTASAAHIARDVSFEPLPESAQLPADLGRDASPWLDRYIAYSRRWSPQSFDEFHEAVGLWMLSTIAARRVVLHLGKPFYTPLFIALAARTSLYAKSTAADIAIEVLKALNLSYLLASDDSTPQKFIYDLTFRLPSDFDKLSEQQQDYAKKRLSRAGQRGWFYDEFGQHIASMMREGGVHADFHGIIRRFDDCKPFYERSTVSRGTDRVVDPYLSLLASLTPADMRKVAKSNSALWGDGFWARFAFVTPGEDYERRRARFPTGERFIPPDITNPLLNWHNRLGLPDIRITDVLDDNGEPTGKKQAEAGDYTPQACTLGDGVFDAFYAYRDGLLDIIDSHSTNEDFDGNYARFPEKALRVAILLASLENGGHIEMRHWARAQEIAERWRSGLHALFDRVNSGDERDEQKREEKALKLVKKLGLPTARLIGIHLHIKTDEAEKLLDGLVKAGELHHIKTGRTVKYQLASVAV